MTVRTFAVMVAAMTLSDAASAQDSVTNFRLSADPGNITGCIALDPAFTRVHTLTVRGGTVEIKSAGGIDDTMKPVRPGIYTTTFQLSGGVLDFVADLPARTLVVTSKNLGCKWNGVPE
jgi:hypothetical protein